MNAGVVKSRYKKSELDKAIKDYREKVLPALAVHDSSAQGFLLVDRNTGDGLSIAVYPTEESAKGFGPKAAKIIEEFKHYTAAAETPQREVYELVVSTQSEAKAIAERGLKSFNAHDMEAIARDAAPDIEGTAPGGTNIKGPQAIKEFNQNFVTAFPDARVEAKKIHAAGNTVVVEGVFRGTHNGTLKTPMGDLPATGRKVEGEYVQIVDIDRGLIKRSHLIYDQVQLLTQLGMAPEPQPHKQQQPAKTTGR
jgi:predicted ester cyclase